MKTRVIFCLAVFALLVSGVATKAEARQVQDPMKYSEEYSKLYAEGDSNDTSGWEGCEYDNSEVDGIFRIHCAGTREIMVHGGHMVRRSFTCAFSFQPSLTAEGNFVVYESCE